MTNQKSHIQRFVFLEIRDPEVYTLLDRLRLEFQGRSDPLHITVRGPYTDTIETRDLQKWQRTVDRDPLLIHSAGTFENDSEVVVYLKAESEGLRKIWYKPDFPIEVYGWNPHISIYRGPDKGFAAQVFKFLRDENLNVLSHHNTLTTYFSRQEDMFSETYDPGTLQFLELANKGVIKADILQRAANTVRRYHIDQDSQTALQA